MQAVDQPLEPIFCGGNQRTVQEREQWASACNCFAVRPGVVLSYDRNDATLDELTNAGFRLVSAVKLLTGDETVGDNERAVISIEGSELVRGGGGALAAPPATESLRLEPCRFAGVDVETTGVRAFGGDRIIEIAVVMLDGTVAFHSLVNPGISVPGFVQGLTGIAPNMLFKAPPFDAIVDDVLDALSGCVFVAHNARFDWAFVSTENERARG